MKEMILCSAIWYKEQPNAKIQPVNINRGVVLCGHRHGHIIHQFVSLTGKRSVTPECGEYEQGFLTNTNRFVGRIEAMKIAISANQIQGSITSSSLYSEDLY